MALMRWKATRTSCAASRLPVLSSSVRSIASILLSQGDAEYASSTVSSLIRAPFACEVHSHRTLLRKWWKLPNCAGQPVPCSQAQVCVELLCCDCLRSLILDRYRTRMTWCQLCEEYCCNGEVKTCYTAKELLIA